MKEIKEDVPTETVRQEYKSGIGGVMNSSPHSIVQQENIFNLTYDHVSQINNSTTGILTWYLKVFFFFLSSSPSFFFSFF